MSAENKKKRSARNFAIAFICLLLISVLNWGFVSSWGEVKVERITILGDDGLKYSAVAYVPKTATNKTPAPGVIIVHGGSGNARNHESQAIELSRRGFVVFSIDNQGGGESEYSKAAGSSAAPEAFMQYMLTMDIIDNDKLVGIAHSAGGGPVYSLGSKYGLKVIIASDCSAGQQNLGTNAAASEVTKSDNYKGNLIYINGEDDFLNPRDKHLATALSVWKYDEVDMGGDTEVQLNKIYGSFEKGNVHQFVEIPNQIHEIAFLSKAHNEVLIDFTLEALGMKGTVPAGSDQVWQWSNVTGALGMAAFCAFVITLAFFIMDSVPFFATLNQSMPRNIGLRGKGLALSIVAALVFPVIILYTGTFGLTKVLFGGQNGNALFNVHYTPLSLGFVFGINLLGILMLLLFWFTDGKKAKAGIRELGLTTEGSKGLDWKMMGKALLLAMITLFLAFEYMDLMQKIAGTEFYCMFFGVRALATYKIKYYIPFVVVWILCFVVSGISINVERRLPSTGNETKDTVIAVIFNVLCAAFMITFLILLQYYLQVNVLHSTARALNWTGAINRLWGVPAGMMIAMTGHTICYRKTGNIWLGAILFGALAALMGCSYGTIIF